jgi:hypothetical protein
MKPSSSPDALCARLDNPHLILGGRGSELRNWRVEKRRISASGRKRAKGLADSCRTA